MLSKFKNKKLKIKTTIKNLKVLLFGILVIGISLKIVNFKLLIAPVRAQDCPSTDYDCQIAQIQRDINAISPAQEKNKLDLAALNKQLADLNSKITKLTSQLKALEKQIFKREEDLAFTKEIFDEKARDHYTFLRLYDPITPFLFSDTASQAFQEITLRQRAADQDRKTMEQYATDLASLNTDKNTLTKNKTTLSGLQSQVAEKQKFLAGEVAKVDSYLTKLSSQQESLIAAKQSALSGAAGFAFDTQTAGSACSATAINYNPSSTQIRVKVGSDVKTMLLEEYLKGLGEMPAAWSSSSNSQEAFKAQAVAARSYALYKIIRSSCRDFDVYSTTADQVWVESKNDGNWNSAVEATRGRILLGGGNVIIAYYSANAGGYTLTPNQAWGAGGNYPTAVNDMGSDGKFNSDLAARCLSDSHYRWEYHYNFGRNGKIQYNDNCPGGDITNNNSPLTNSEMEDIIDAAIWAQKNGRVPDNSMNHDQIKAELGGESIGSLQSINANIANNQNTSTVHTVGSNRTVDIDGNTFKKVFNVRSPGQYFISGSRSSYSKYDILTSSEAHGTQGSGWYVYTYGYGHRIGLDQEGALGMASQGKSHTEILSHYYQGTSLTPVGYSGTIQ